MDYAKKKGDDKLAGASNAECVRKGKTILTKLNSYIRFLEELSHVNRNEWQVAIRKRTAKTLYEGNGSGFVAVKNTVRYWFADPFLFSYKGKDYLFVEMFDRWKEKGVIGVARIRNGKCGIFRMCLELPGHLSYPCVYEDADGIHMVPECYQSGEVWIYRCTKFPYHWEKERKIIAGFAVDTTPCFFEGEKIWLTTRFESAERRINDNLWQINNETGKMKQLATEAYATRGAGHIIVSDSYLIRPSQNCKDGYGKNLVFNQGRIENGIYQEKPFLQVVAPQCFAAENSVTVVCAGLKSECSGLHTYNINSNYEVIDLRFSENRSCIALLKNWCKHISQKLRK